MLIPTRVHFEQHKNITNQEQVQATKIIDVCCGTFHSLATDINNNVWSWGGRGDICLGHNDSELSGVWAQRSQNIFPTLTNLIKHMIPFELVDWCKKWSLPRMIKSLKYDNDFIGLDRIVQLSAGDMHTTVLYQSGRIYLCGNGPVVSPIQMKIEEEETNDADGNEVDDIKSESTSQNVAKNVIDEIQKKMVPVTTPRCPSSIWYDKLASRKTKFVVSAGNIINIILKT